MTSKSVRDPIHGLIPLSSDEWKAVNSPVFQRLRNVRQLALTLLVYPGAHHTRFEHSIGVRHVSGRLAATLDLGQDDQAAVRAAALLHDVGHGVFSHVSEQVIDDLSGAHGVHEAVSAAIMRKDEDLRNALSAEVCDRAADLIAGEGGRSVARDIVSGPTDADKLDYLLRDSYFAGVNYGRYDLARVIESARTIAPGGASTQLGFSSGGLWAVEELLMARHHMHRQVYGHKTRLATDIMLTRALRAAIANGTLPAEAYKVPMLDGKPAVDSDFLAAYLEQTDARVLDRLCEAPEGSVERDLGRRLNERRLFRQTVSLWLDQHVEVLGDVRLALIRDPDEFTPARIAEMELALSTELNLEPHLVALYLDTRANPTYRTPGRGAIDSKDIMFQRGDDPPLRLERESEIFNHGDSPGFAWLHLYTPDLGSTEMNDKAKEFLWTQLHAL